MFAGLQYRRKSLPATAQGRTRNCSFSRAPAAMAVLFDRLHSAASLSNAATSVRPARKPGANEETNPVDIITSGTPK